MLTKCANTACSNTFRYLHDGRLYLINAISCFDARTRSSTPASKYGSPEYAWLCSGCSSYLTIHIDEENGTIMVCASEATRRQEFRESVLNP